jgi:hypothetical protein
MERCHSRSMEHFRRLGIADEVRKVGYSADPPLDAFLVRSLDEPAIAQLPVPSVAESRKQSERTNDGRFPAEPYQIVSQYALEPLLKSVAEKVPGVTWKQCAGGPVGTRYGRDGSYLTEFAVRRLHACD